MGRAHQSAGGLIGAPSGAVGSVRQIGMSPTAVGSELEPFRSMSHLATVNPGSGYFWFNMGPGAEELYAYKDASNKYWVMTGSIGSGLGHPDSSGGNGDWFGKWTTADEFGSARYAMAQSFKSKHWHSGTFDDLLVMQGFVTNTAAAPFDASTEVAYANGIFTSRGRNMRQMFASHISLANHSPGGGTTISCTFLKGNATQSRSRYRPSAQGELSATNVFHFGLANAESITYAMVNALGCQGTFNNEHYAWVGNNADAGYYPELNFPSPNHSGEWGINRPNGEWWLYWLFFYA